jgi:phenylalanyl-tRNA synthetase alpha chain
MFRPEMMYAVGLPQYNALAWGLGVDRLALFALGLDDLRELFSGNLAWLRNQKMLGEEV